MSPTKVHQPQDVVADINYFIADGTIRKHGELEQRYLGKKYDGTRPMTIHDVRGKERDFELYRNGFQFIKLPSKDRNVRDASIVRQEYYAEVEDLVKKLTGASHAHCFNHVIRQVHHSIDEGNHDMQNPDLNGPAGHPHVDYSDREELMEGVKASVPLPEHLRSKYDTCSRYAFIGTWRPLKTLVKDPLAVCDATTVPASDYQLKVRTYPNGSPGGNCILGHGREKEQHQWYYMHEMQPDEMIVFNGYDTKKDEAGWRCPHTGFVIPGSEDLPPRESIETRVVCFWD